MLTLGAYRDNLERLTNSCYTLQENYPLHSGEKAALEQLVLCVQRPLLVALGKTAERRLEKLRALASRVDALLLSTPGAEETLQEPLGDNLELRATNEQAIRYLREEITTILEDLKSVPPLGLGVAEKLKDLASRVDEQRSRKLGSITTGIDFLLNALNSLKTALYNNEVTTNSLMLCQRECALALEIMPLILNNV